MPNIYATLASAIIKQQELIVGPIAWTEADKVGGLTVRGESVIVKNDGKKVIESLVKQYETLFGKASVLVCKDAVKNIVIEADKKTIPSILQ
jgi:hypothetical protein